MEDKDYTSYIERMVGEESQRLANTMKSTIQEYRPLGSKEVPIEEQEVEFRAMLDYPEVYSQFLKDQGASVESAIRYAHQMTKRLREKK